MLCYKVMSDYFF